MHELTAKGHTGMPVVVINQTISIPIEVLVRNLGTTDPSTGLIRHTKDIIIELMPTSAMASAIRSAQNRFVLVLNAQHHRVTFHSNSTGLAALVHAMSCGALRSALRQLPQGLLTPAKYLDHPSPVCTSGFIELHCVLGFRRGGQVDSDPAGPVCLLLHVLFGGQVQDIE